MINLRKIEAQVIDVLEVIIRNGLVVLNDGLVLLPVKKHYCMFESFNGRDISDNPLAIYKELIKEHPDMRNKAIFSVEPHLYKSLKKRFPHIRMIRRFLPQWCYYMARSQFWIFNSRTPTWWKKSKHTTYIQTWHGTPLKKLACDMKQVKMPGTTAKHYKKHFVKETQRWDYLIAPNSYSEHIFKHAFKFHNHFLKVGYPRNDILYKDNNPKVIKHLKKELVGNPNANVITYAPTWRDDDYLHQGAYRFELKFNFKKFFKHVSKNTVLIIRPHYLIKTKIKIPKQFKNRVKVIRITDISKIYLITDLLITDYSSVMFDFANLNRPMLFFAYDLKHYQGVLRGFYLNYYHDLPGPITTTANELYHQLDVYNKYHQFPKYKKRMQQFRKRCCTWESENSSKKVVKKMNL